ncbi:MAG: phage major capsid protein, partial [Oscillospiraceae bacterium]|nr:phage major capsid protein [Oscillospiraceae bacterium]
FSAALRLSIKDELESRKAAENQRDEIRKAVAAGAGAVVTEIKEETKMTNEEVRSSKAYIDAFAKYLINEDDRECRSLLTETVSGSVPVPAFVDSIIHAAWENDAILSRVKKTNIRGNLKVAFERSADPAYAHTEGTTAVTEESLTLGIVTMIPKNIKKWITISDEAIAMGGETLVRYIYDEVTYQIVKELAKLVVTDIAGADTSHSSSAVGVPKITMAPGVTTVASAAANLSDQARNVVVIMNRLTEVAFLEAHAAGNFAVDPFAGVTKVYTSALPAYATASANAVYAIVGDLDGAQVNYPEGEGVVIKYDDLSLAEADLVKIVGRQYAAHGVTAPGKFCNIAKPSAVTT